MRACVYNALIKGQLCTDLYENFVGSQLKMDHKEHNFEKSSSVNFEFLYFSGVHIATCT